MHRRPKFEELSDEEDGGNNEIKGSHSKPKVEEPEDYKNRRDKRESTIMNNFFDDDPFFSGSFFSNANSIFNRHSEMMKRMHNDFESMFERSSVGGDMLNNNNGRSVYYCSTTTTTSSNGVTETKRKVQDSRTGTERVTVKRQIGDKSCIIDKTKDREGREQNIKRLENVKEEEESLFEEEWKKKSEYLPRWGRFDRDDKYSLTNSIHHNNSKPKYKSLENKYVKK
ncbi:hypothetical protein ABK040_006292 [Willaertia magna]